jgi:hypothetical protein
VFILDCKNKLNEVKKVKSIANWIKYSGKGMKKELTFPNHMVELCYQSLASWRVNEGMVLKAALESENKSN